MFFSNICFSNIYKYKIKEFFFFLFNQYPQIILPAAQKPLSLTSSGASDAGSVSGSSANAASPAPSNSSNNPSEQPLLRPLGKLEEMKGILKSKIRAKDPLRKTENNSVYCVYSERSQGGTETSKSTGVGLETTAD